MEKPKAKSEEQVLENKIESLIAIGGLQMSNCENCKFRAKYDNNSRSILGRMWKWHIGWCPGWKAYLKSLPDEKSNKLREQYS